MPRTPRLPLLLALACLVGLALTGVLTYLVPVAQVRDAAALHGFETLNRPWLTPVIDGVAHLADPLPYALIGFGLAGVALLRRRPRTAAAIVGLLVLTGLTSQTLKPLLAAPRDDWFGSDSINPASWPSGHATAAMTLALCAILAVPARARPTAAVVGALFAVSVSYAILALGWHFPSDVLGGFLVAATWTLLAVAGLVALEQRRPSVAGGEARVRPGDTLAPLAAFGLGGAALAAAVLVARPREIARFVVEHATFVAGAAGIGALAVVLAAALVLARGVRSVQ